MNEKLGKMKDVEKWIETKRKLEDQLTLSKCICLDYLSSETFSRKVRFEKKYVFEKICFKDLITGFYTKKLAKKFLRSRQDLITEYKKEYNALPTDVAGYSD